MHSFFTITKVHGWPKPALHEIGVKLFCGFEVSRYVVNLQSEAIEKGNVYYSELSKNNLAYFKSNSISRTL